MRRILAVLLVAVVLVGLLAPPLSALDVGTAVSVGGLLAGLAPILTTLVTSGLTWALNAGLGLIRDWSDLAKYAVMGVVGVLTSAGFAALGHTVSADVASWGPAAIEGMAAAAVAAVIYKIGRGAR